MFPQQAQKQLPNDDLCRIMAIGGLNPQETAQVPPIWTRIANGTSRPKKKQLIRNWWITLRAQHPILPAEPTPDIYTAIIDMCLASDTQAPKPNGLYPAMLMSVSASENYEQNQRLHNQDRATFLTATDLEKTTGRDFTRIKFSFPKVKDGLQCYWILLLALFGKRCQLGRLGWQLWTALCAQHRYDDDYDRFTRFIGPQLMSAFLIKAREALSICPTMEELSLIHI